MPFGEPKCGHSDNYVALSTFMHALRLGFEA